MTLSYTQLPAEYQSFDTPPDRPMLFAQCLMAGLDVRLDRLKCWQMNDASTHDSNYGRFIMAWSSWLGSLRLNSRVALAGAGVCLAVSMAACTAQTESPQTSLPPAVAQPPPALPAPPPAPHETGAKPSKTVKTSYQGTSTAGRTTASGERYNPNGLTAASRNLPIGSKVTVTNPDTGRSVKVRINDRGPFVHGRSLDLSKRAAEKIGITHKGVTRVKVAPVDSHPVSGDSVPAAPVATPAGDK
ncbi:MAG: septal ring lytic transglycosylase RlpA family protein [Limisphaerales bacterium]